MNDVDQLIEDTPLNKVLLHYGLSPADERLADYRMACVFNESCAEDSYGNLKIKLDSAKRIYCHSCRTRGNLLTLIHGLERRCPPNSGRLRGPEFKEAVARLREIHDGIPEGPAVTTNRLAPAPTAPQPEAAAKVNPPLRRHEKEAARALATLHEELVTDVAQMSPAAGAYVRSRSWLTPELMQKWGVGWIPGDGRSMFRKNYLVYTHRNERGEVVSYSGRDLSFAEKHAKWVRNGQPDGKKPGKHRYVSGFHRGVELYGGHAGRLQETAIQESLERYGLVVVEGLNEVLRMDSLNVAAVGLGSNRATKQQTSKLIRFAQDAGDNRIVLLPDCDDEGETGFRELLWRLAEAQVHIRLGCSQVMCEGEFAGRQPESFTAEEWSRISTTLTSTPDD